MSASLYLTIVKGGPLDGLPTLSLRFEKESDELDFGSVLSILNAMTPPPMHFQIVYAAGVVDPEGIARLLKFVHGKGMASSVDIFGDFEPWMMEVGRRIFHTNDACVPHPVEEIVFHNPRPPAPIFFPFHIVSRPVLWWAGAGTYEEILRYCPQGFRLYIPRKVPEIKLFPKEKS